MPLVAVAAIGAASSIYGASKQSKAAKSAANVQSQAASDANATQLQMYNQSRQDAEPWRQAGMSGLSEYMNLLGLQQPSGQGSGGQLGQMGMNPQQSQQDAFGRFRSAPGYQFGLDEGMRSVQASAAARGGLNSGAALKSLFEYGNNYADQQGYTPYMNRLASLSNIGQTQASNNAAMGQNYANAYGQNVNLAGDARANGIYGSANAWSNGAAGVASGLGSMIGNSSWGRK